MAKKRLLSADGSAIAAGSEDPPKTKTAAAIRFVAENPELVDTHTHKELADLISQKYKFESVPGDVANAKALVRKGRGLKRRATKKASRAVAETSATAEHATVKPAPASASTTDAVNATLNLVRAVGLEQAAAIISGLTKSK